MAYTAEWEGQFIELGNHRPKEQDFWRRGRGILILSVWPYDERCCLWNNPVIEWVCRVWRIKSAFQKQNRISLLVLILYKGTEEYDRKINIILNSEKLWHFVLEKWSLNLPTIFQEEMRGKPQQCAIIIQGNKRYENGFVNNSIFVEKSSRRRNE